MSCSKCWDRAVAARDSRFCTTSGRAARDFHQRRCYGTLRGGKFEMGACHQSSWAWEEDPQGRGRVASALVVSGASGIHLLDLAEWQGASKDPPTGGKAGSHASDKGEEETHSFLLKAPFPARSRGSCLSAAHSHRWSARSASCLACRCHSQTQVQVSGLLEVFLSGPSSGQHRGLRQGRSGPMTMWRELGAPCRRSSPPFSRASVLSRAPQPG